MYGKKAFLAATVPHFRGRRSKASKALQVLRASFTLPAMLLTGGMVALGTLAKPSKEQAKPQEAARPMVPFIRASHEHFEGAFSDTTTTPGASSVALTPADVSAYGFMRSIVLTFLFASGDATGGTLSADYPFNILDEIVLLDVNGAPIVGPFPSYDAYLAHTFGGYAWNPRPEDHPDYVGTINAAFMLRIPVEITAWDGLGSLANQNAAASYKVRATVAPSTTIFATPVMTIPTVRIRMYLEAWSPPAAADVFGNPQEQFPPNHGTTQFWSTYVKTVSAGAQTVLLTRVGNMIRNLIFVTRTSAGARTTAHWPDPVTVNWDARQVIANEPQFYRRGVMRERFGFALPAGVFVYDLTHDQDGHPGNENRHLWYPTVQATRLEVTGTFGSGASQLRILTNDVAPVGAPVTPVGGPVGAR